MWSLFYNNTRLLILTILLIVITGFLSYATLPRLEDPVLTQRAATIETSLPGASANRVESLVTEKIEQALFEIDEIEQIESISSTGLSTVIVWLDDRLSRVERVWAEVRDRLADTGTQLPENASEPDYQALEARAFNMIVALVWDSEVAPSYAVLRRTTEALSDQFRFVRGTERVELIGEPKEEIVVEANPTNLAARGLTIQDLTQQIQASDAKVSVGKLRSASNELLIEPATELASLEQVRGIPIRFGGEGQFTYLGDIAQVRRGIIEPPESLALINNRQAIALGALVESNRRVDRWRRQIYQLLDRFDSTLPNGMRLEIIFDQNEYVENRINGLFLNLIVGVLLVIGSTMVIMGWRSALIIGFSLPLSVLMVLGIMGGLGIPLHQMSVTGLVMALGLLIDNAIVVVDELQHELRQGIPPKIAVPKSIRFLAMPLLASTMTTVFTFMPNALMTGKVGEFIRTVGISVILSLVCSLLLSLTVIPALYGRFYRADDRAAGGPRGLRDLWRKGFSHPRLTRQYHRVLEGVFSQPRMGILLALILPVAGFVVAFSFDHQLFPAAERDQIHIEVELQPQAALGQTQLIAQQVQARLVAHSEVKQVYWFLGENAPAIYYNFPKARSGASNYTHGIVQLQTVGRPALLQTLQQELDAAFPAARILVRRLEQGPVPGAPIQIRLYGSNLEVLRLLGNEVRAELSQIPQVTYHRASLSTIQPTLGLQVDEEQARLAGLDNISVTQQLSSSIEGTVGGSILEDTEELPIRVRLSNQNRGSLKDISSLDLLPSGASGAERSPIPLASISHMELVPALSSISRRNGQRVNTVEAFVDAGVLPSRVLETFRQRLQAGSFQLPSGYLIEFGGEFSERNDAISNLFAKAPIFIMLMVASLVLAFGSFQLAAMIVLIALCSVGLAFMSLWVFDYSLGFMAILGTAGLVGLAVNDSIVVLAALQAHPLARQGNIAAICQVTVRSTRHVLATTITTIAGFIPLLINGGQFWSPLAVAIAGGVGGATLLALFFIPCLYILWVSRGHRHRLPDREYRTSNRIAL